MGKKTIKIEEDTHHQLNMFRVKHSFKTFDEAIKKLMEEQKNE